MTTTINVSNKLELNQAIATVDGTAAAGDYVIALTADISLGGVGGNITFNGGTIQSPAELYALNVKGGVTVTIDGQGHKIDGAAGGIPFYRGVLVYSGDVTLKDLTIANTRALGGSGYDGGGSGAGLGGGLYVANDSGNGAAPGNVTLNNVTFTTNSAEGGTGNTFVNGHVPAGAGGGLGGAGQGGGAGGIGAGATGASNNAPAGGEGLVLGAASGGAGVQTGSGGGTATAGGAYGGGGGWTNNSDALTDSAGGGGGIGGGNASTAVVGGAGGYGGGGSEGKAGGFGGGGGSSGNPGTATAGVGADGGFGGGGGGGVNAGGKGGFGAGDGNATIYTSGGGGLGAGGAIFVQSGASLTITGNTTQAAGTVKGGNFGGALAGQSYGSGIFLQGDETITFAPAAGQTITFAGDIADQTGSGGTGGNAGAGAIVINGDGAVQLNGTNTFTGGITVNKGTLTGNLGSNGVTVKGTLSATSANGANLGTGTIKLDGGTIKNAFAGDATVGNAIQVLAGGGTILPNSTVNILTLSGNITGSGPMTFGDGSTGTVSLSGSNAGFTGATTLKAGTTLRAGSTTGLSSGSAFTLETGSTIDLRGNNSSIGSLAGAGTVLGANGVLTVGGNNASTTFTGALGDNLVDDLGLIKTGAGTLILNGTNGNLTKGMTVTSGTIQIGSGGSAGQIGGAITDNATLAYNTSSNITQANADIISGTGALKQQGSGTLLLTTVNTYSGATTVSGGTLDVAGSAANSAFTVKNGGTLTGTGTVGSVTVESGGTLSTGTSKAGGSLTGPLATGALTLASGAILSERINGTAGGSYDKLVVTGAVDISGSTLTIFTSNGSLGSGAITTGTSFTIIDNDGAGDAVTGMFANANGSNEVLIQPFLGGGQINSVAYRVNTAGGDGNDVVLTMVNTQPILGVVPGAKTVSSGATSAVAFGVSDADVGQTLTATVTASGGTMTSTSGSGTQGGNGTATFTISGSIAAVNTALGGLTYTSTAGAADTLKVSVQDNSGASNNTWVSTVKINGGLSTSYAIAAASATKAEGNAGSTAFTFTVTRSGDLSANNVNYAVTGTGGSPADAADFGGALPSGTLTFAASEISKTLTINVSGDVASEPDETFLVTLSGATGGAGIGTATATGTIQNDDTTVAGYVISPSSIVQNEGAAGSTAYTYTVTRSGNLTAATTIDYAVTGTGGAQASASDFVGAALPFGTLNFASNDTTKTIVVNVAGDTTPESTEGFLVTLSNASAAGQINTATATGTITDDDTVTPSGGGSSGNSGTPSGTPASTPSQQANFPAAITAFTRMTPAEQAAVPTTIVDLQGKTVPNPLYVQLQAEKSIAAALDAGLITPGQAQSQLFHLVDGTVSVANVAYAFFTGKTPTSQGLDFLVHSSGNPTDLNDGYYASMAVENRYINFGANLSRGSANFANQYATLNINDTVAKAYQQIFGYAADAAKIDALVNTQVPNGRGGTETRLQYFADLAADSSTGLATKGAFIGWLLGEAIKSDSGPYAAAEHAFLANLAQGNAPYNVDLVGFYHTAG